MQGQATVHKDRERERETDIEQHKEKEEGLGRDGKVQKTRES